MDEGHIKYAEHREGMLYPEGVVSIMPEPEPCYNGGGEDRDKTEGEGYVEGDIVHMLILFKKHKRGDIRGPLTHLKRQEGHHLRAVHTVADV